MPMIERSDVENVYRQQIRPSLRRLGVRVIRIDEVEHSDNIDERILREIDASDIVVADLTHARPSVYFEAGYAVKAGVPVIYTCRKDHLSPKSPNDPRVHFDVNHRKIIHWSGRDDESFSRRLQRHLTVVAKPIRDQKQKDAKLEREAIHFGALSQLDRLRAIATTAGRVLGSSDFELAGSHPPSADAWGSYQFVARTPGSLTTVFLLVASGFTQKDLRRLWEFSWPAIADKMAKDSVPRLVSHNLVLASLSAVPSKRIERIFHEFGSGGDIEGIARSFLMKDGRITWNVRVIDNIAREEGIAHPLSSLLHAMVRPQGG
jgi:nucleoside 2-deoxyribosyltransferase